MSTTITEQQPVTEKPQTTEKLITTNKSDHDEYLSALSSLQSNYQAKESYTNFTDFFWNNTFSRIFLRKKFGYHRVVGLSYLIQYAIVVYLYFFDYPTFLKSPFLWSLPLTGVIQSVVAVNTFTFLPKKQSDPGYFSDKTVLSYAFIRENQFFALCLFFAWVYYSDRFFWLFKLTFVPEALMVFFPYALRQAFPKTRMRDALANNEKKNSEYNRTFFHYGTYVTKTFYIWAKHYIQYFLNYIVFLERADETTRYHLYLLLIFSCFATTISLFLHTLKFKGYISPRTSFSAYVISYLCTFYSFYQISGVFFANFDVFIICAIGVALNFTRFRYQLAWQAVVFSLFYGRRLGFVQPGLILYQ